MRRASAILALAVVAASATAAADPPEQPDAGDELVLIPTVDELEALEALDDPELVDEARDQRLVRSTSRLDVPLAEAPGIVTVIMGSELRAMGARTLFDALRYAPELDVTRDAFGYYHVAVRGRRVDSEVLVLIDGHRLNDFYDGRILYELPVSLVERIEILRGPSSALYGTNAFAGVISVYTRRQRAHELSAMTSTNGGDRDRIAPSSLWVAGYAGGALGSRLRGFGSIEVARESGPELLIPEDSLTRNRMDPDTGESQSRSCDNQPVADCPDTAYSRLPRTLLRASGQLESRPGALRDSDRLTAGLHAIYVDKGPFIGEFDTLTPDSRLRHARLLANAGYELPVNRSGSMTLALSSWLDLTRVDREIQVAPDGFKELFNGAAEPFPDGQLKEIEYDELVVRQDARFRWTAGGRNTLIAGFEVEHIRMPRFEFRANYDDAGRQYDQLGNYFDFDLEQDGATRTVLGLYAEDLWSAPAGLKLVAGGRVDVYSDFGTAISPRLGAIWRRGDLSLKLFYGWAFRAPTFQELYDQTGRIDLGQYIGNRELDASRVKTLEAAVLYVLALDDLLVELTLTGANSQISDSIDRAPLSGLANSYFNSSDVASSSASAEVRVELLRRYSGFVNASWQIATADYEYVDPSQGLNFDTETDLVNVPRYRVNVGLRGQLGDRFAAGAFLEAGSSRRNNRRTPLEGQHFFDYDPYALIQIYGEANRLWRNLYVRLGVRNLTDTEVADEPFRANRMPLGIPRDQLRVDATLAMDF